MATFWSDRGRERGPSQTGRVIFDHYNGKLRARAWPRPKTKPEPPEQRERQEWFREANYLARYTPAKDAIARRNQTAGTVLMPRDLLVMALAGRLVAPTLENGRKWHSIAMVKEVSDALDALVQDPQALLYRDQHGWTALKPSAAGQYLQSTQTGFQWAQPSTGGSTLRSTRIARLNSGTFYGTYQPIPFDTAVMDGPGMADLANNALIVPLDATMIWAYGGAWYAGESNGHSVELQILLDGNYIAAAEYKGAYSPVSQVHSGPYPVQGGETLQLRVGNREGAGIADHQGTFFAVTTD